MKKLIILTSIILPLLYIGCKDNSTNTVTSPVQIGGKIVNINYSPGLYVVATVTKNDTFATTIVLDSSLITSDGSFTISLNTPPDNALDSVLLPSCPGNIHISSNEIKEAVLNLFVDSLGKQMGNIQKSNRNPDSTLPPYPVGWFIATNLYYNMNGSITGSDTCINMQDTLVFTYQLNINKGWNTASSLNVFSSYTKQSWQITSQEPSGGKWYFHRGLFAKKYYLMK